MTIAQIPYGLLPNGNYGINLDPTTKKPLTAVIEVLSAVPSLTDSSNFDGRLIFDTTDGRVYVYTTVPVATWKPLEGIPAAVGNVSGTPPTVPTPLSGSLYWDLDTQVLFVWNNTAWIPAGGAYATKIMVASYTGDGTTTTYLTGSTTPITANYVEAYWNGVAQTPFLDYTVVGTSVIFTTPPPTAVKVYIRAFESTTIVDNAQVAQAQYVASAGDTIVTTGQAGSDPSGIFVYVNGVLSTPSTDYNITQHDTTITSLIKASSTVAQATTTVAHNIPVGSYVKLLGFTETQYNNITVQLTAAPSSTTFQFTVLPTDPVSGTPNPTAIYTPSFVNDTIVFTNPLSAGDKVDIRSLRNVVVSGPAGEANTLGSVGTGVSLASSQAGTILQTKSILAGNNVTVTDLGNEVQITANLGPGTEDRVGINSNTYTISGTISYIGVRNTGTGVNVYLTGVTQTTTNSGRKITVKDESGGAGVNNITVHGSPSKIDGTTAPYIITSNYGSVTMVFDGTDWFVVNKI